jgi:hypothetical protein
MNRRTADWQALLRSVARLQREVPDAVLVGGTAVALLAGHRYSTDADHVVGDLSGRYWEVRQHLEGLEGWATARASEPVLILGSLDGQAAGVRQLRRAVPLETQVIDHAGQRLCVPSYDELARIKAFLLLDRNYTRDYVDFLALTMPLDGSDIKSALAPLDDLYGTLVKKTDRITNKGLIHDLGMALRRAEPRSADRREWAHFEAMEPGEPPWDVERIRREAPSMGNRVLDIWRELDDDRGADRLPVPRDQPPPKGVW